MLLSFRIFMVDGSEILRYIFFNIFDNAAFNIISYFFWTSSFWIDFLIIQIHQLCKQSYRVQFQLRSSSSFSFRYKTSRSKTKQSGSYSAVLENDINRKKILKVTYLTQGFTEQAS